VASQKPPGRDGNSRGPARWRPFIIAIAGVTLAAAVALVVNVVAGQGLAGSDPATRGSADTTSERGGTLRSTRPTTAPDEGMGTWTAPANEGPRPGEVIRVVTVNHDLIVVTQRDVTSIDRRTGEKNWHTGLERFDTAEGPIVFCGASTTSVDDRLALTLGVDLESPESGNVYRPSCGLATSMDLRTGTLGEAVQLGYEGGGPPKGQQVDGMPVEYVGDQIVVTWNATIFGLDAADLSTRWKFVVGDQEGRQGDLCSIDDMAIGGGGDSVVTISGCITETGETTYHVDEVTDSGRLAHTYQPSNSDAKIEISSLDLLSGDPVVIYVHGQLGGTKALITLDESWQGHSVIRDSRTQPKSSKALTTVGIGWDTRIGSYHIPSRSLVSGDTMVSFTPPNRGRENELVATNLRTKEEIWTCTAPSGTVIWQVLAIEKGRVFALAADISADGSKHHVISVDSKSGKFRDQKSTAVTTPGGDGASASHLGYVYADGRAYAVDFQSAGEPGGEFAEWLAFSVG
jgi:hypothetical protein